MEDLYAKCGNNCGRCPLYRDNLTDDLRRWCADGMAKYIGWHPTPERLRPCGGCQATDGFLYIRNCRVRRCAQYNGAENCAYCAVFPCRDVPAVSLSVGYRDQVAERLGGRVPDEDFLAFIEPYEGMKHLETIRASLDPQQLVEAKAVKPLKTRLVGFPEGMALSTAEAAGFRALYELMTNVLLGRAELYVRQVALKQRRKDILNMLWVFGRHGELDETGSTLVIDGEKHGAQPGFNNIVRKRDNALHGSAAASASLLADFGVTVEHVPLPKRNWLLRLSFDERAGGPAALRALPGYTLSLIEKHGEAVYAGSSRYKGEAFARFSKADMGVLARG